MGSGWSEEQQPPPPQSPQIAAGNAAGRSNGLNANSNQTSMEERGKAAREKADVVKLTLPHAFDLIVRAADSPVDRSSMDKLYHQLYSGIFLNKRTKKYWVEKKSNSNCFMLFARALSITWAEDAKYWKWKPPEESSDAIEVAELLDVCWLELHGKINTSELSPATLYEVSFIIMIKDPSYGWEVPVNIRLTHPDGTKQEHKVNLMEKPRGQWVEITAGDYMVRPQKPGDLEFCMYEYEGGMWKKGLLVKGVVIRPKN